MDVPSPQAIRVLLADDHEWLRQSLRVLFDRLPAFTVVQDVGNRSAAIDAANDLSPDVVVIDLSTPDGFEALRRLNERRPDIATVVVTEHLASALEALNAGASGYVLRQSTFGALVRAVEAAARKRRLVDHGVADAAAPRGTQCDVNARSAGS